MKGNLRKVGPGQWIRQRLRPSEDRDVDVTPDLLDGTTADHALLTAYWSAQQQRIGQHETARFQFSAFVIAGSVASLGFVGSGSMSQLGRGAAGIAVAMINVIAVVFVRNELRWIKVHQDRAAIVLEGLDPILVQAQEVVNARWKARAKSGENDPRLTSSEILCLVHATIVLAALIVAFAPHS